MIVAYLSALYLSPDFVPWICLGLILGNRYPCFHHFRGGKGVANYLGFTLMVAPIAALASMVAWVLVYQLARIPFVASLVMVGTLVIGTLLYIDLRLFGVSGVLLTALFVFFNHRPNIREWMHKGRAAD